MQGFIKLGNPIELSDKQFYKLSKFIYDNYGINLPITKKTLLESRLQKHLRKLGATSFQKYIDNICSGTESEEVVNMINLVSTNKTHFFRESLHFSFLQNEVLPHARPSAKDKFQIWSAAASTGEEVYSIAITLEEFLAKNGQHINYSILGTDISTDALQVGDIAIYSEKQVEGLPLDLKKKYLLKSIDRKEGKVRVIKKIRDKTLFKRFNLIQDRYPAPETFDVIFCRNVLIYFDKPTQERVIRNLARCLRVGGYLFLGHSESLMGIDLPLKPRVHTGYQKMSIC